MKKALSLALAAAMAASLAACDRATAARSFSTAVASFRPFIVPGSSAPLRRFSRCIYGQLRCNNGHRSFRRRFCRRPDPEGHAV